MPTKSKPVNKPVARPVTKPGKKPDWEAMLGSLASSGAGPFFFIKSARTRIRLVCLEPNEEEFFAGSQVAFKGKPKTKYVVFAIVLGTEGGKGPLADEWKNKIVPLVLSKTALSGILSILSEGYNLFGEKDGHGITILKSGTGTDTDYTVTTSPQPVPLNLDNFERPEKSLIEYAEELSSRSAKRNSDADDSQGGDW